VTDALDLSDVVEVIRVHAGDALDEVAIASDTRLEDLNISSLDQAELMLALEERTGTVLDLAEVDDTQTVGDLVELTRRHGQVA
jgi:acyl carrier protein